MSYVNIPVKYLDENGKAVVVVEPWPILDPHETLHFLFEQAELTIPAEKVKEYWQTSQKFGEPFAKEVKPEFDSLMPIGLYGDSARVDTRFGHENVMAFFLNCCLFRPKSVRWSRFVILTIPEERLTTESIRSILRRITWSCNHAFNGFFPTEGHLGQNLDGKALKKAGLPLTSRNLRFQVVELRGDWAWHKKIWQFQCHWNGQNVCHQCTAKGLGASWEDLYWNIDSNNHTEFSLTGFLAHRIPDRKI